MSDDISTDSWTATRYSIATKQSYDDLRASFEHEVPTFPADEFARRVKAGATWEQVLEFAESLSPLGLLIYWKDEPARLMSLAGDTARCTEYFIGNFPIAQRMFHLEPRVMNYLPLRMTITESAAGVVHFTTDKPSAGLGSFGVEAVGSIAGHVDQKVASLLRSIGLPVPESLTGVSPPA